MHLLTITASFSLSISSECQSVRDAWTTFFLYDIKYRTISELMTGRDLYNFVGWNRLEIDIIFFFNFLVEFIEEASYTISKFTVACLNT